MIDETWLGIRDYLIRSYKCISNANLRGVYGQDMFAHRRSVPELVVVPENTEELESLCRYLFLNKTPFLVRGSGTNYTGGVVPDSGCLVVVVTTKLCRILSIDETFPQAVVESGVINDELNTSLRCYGLMFPPDPTSSQVCTIGGNLAENAGGPNGLFYGVTHDYVQALEVLLPTGEKIICGSHADSAAPPGLCSLFIGSEGTLGVILRAWLRLVPKPTSVVTVEMKLLNNNEAVYAVEAILGIGLDPILLELLAEPECPHNLAKSDKLRPLILFALNENSVAATQPAWERVAKQFKTKAMLSRQDAKKRRAQLLIERRAEAQLLYGLGNRVSIVDAVVPRHALPTIMQYIAEIASSFNLVIMNSFHAGDGNIHPLFFFSTPEEGEHIENAKLAILRRCIELDGSIAAEHGIGLEKRALLTEMLNKNSVRLLNNVKRCIDPFDILNPGKAVW